ncbi:MAG: ferredoxin [Cellvibrio sp.]
MAKEYAWHPERDKKNCDGAFYTLQLRCMDCGMPEAEAPTLLSQDPDDSDTYFIKQPSTPAEIESACNAIEICCVDALRYAGKDKAIIARLGNTVCDYDIHGKLNIKQQQFSGNRLARLKHRLQFWFVNSFKP